MLAAIGMDVKQQIDRYVLDLVEDDFILDKIEALIPDILNISLKVDLTKKSALKFLNRLIRICSVVKNQKELGDGLFVLDNNDYFDLQICEATEIDLEDEKQVAILNDSEYFNPG